MGCSAGSDYYMQYGNRRMGLQIVKKDYILNYIYDKDILIQIFMSVFYQ